MLSTLTSLHGRFFASLENITNGWLLGLAARFVFAAVVYVYYLNSALTKVNEGVLGFFQIRFGAYIQILSEGVLSGYGFDAANVPFFPQYLLVFFGTYGEFLLPLLVVIGLFTRLASIGMIGFILVQSYVDIAFHGAGDETIGAWFDRDSASLIMDQRTLWVFLLLVLIIKGAGAVSADTLLARWWKNRN
ncbi:MAG: DoxX family protein [Rhizobiaceae bacterium]|nr:DoxX family protein [Rhizobiaceae bacterium]